MLYVHARNRMAGSDTWIGRYGRKTCQPSQEWRLQAAPWTGATVPAINVKKPRSAVGLDGYSAFSTTLSTAPETFHQATSVYFPIHGTAASRKEYHVFPSAPSKLRRTHHCPSNSFASSPAASSLRTGAWCASLDLAESKRQRPPVLSASPVSGRPTAGPNLVRIGSAASV